MLGVLIISVPLFRETTTFWGCVLSWVLRFYGDSVFESGLGETLNPKALNA